MSFRVVVADNFQYMDDSEYHEAGSFETEDAAVSAARAIVDAYLRSALKPGMSAKDLYDSYTSFGDDPFIVSSTGDRVTFSAWTYAQTRCEEMCSAK